MSEISLKHWIPVEDRDYTKFREAYWGKDILSPILNQPLERRFLSITQTDVLDLIKAPPLNSAFLFREEYQTFINRLDAAWSHKETTGMHGCLLLGQPAIGKSCFLLFFLIRCLSHRQIVLFTTSSGRTYLFHECGVASVKTSEFAASLHLPPRAPDSHGPLFWSLVDCPDKKEPIPSSVTHGTRRLFFVAAVSPDTSRYALMEGRTTIRSYWMSPWLKGELVALWTRFPHTDVAPEQEELYKLQRLPSESDPSGGFKFDLETIESLVADVGPCPQDILSHLRAPRRHQQSIERAIEQYKSDILSLQHLLVHADALSNEISHKLVLVSRAPLEPSIAIGSPDSGKFDNADDQFVVYFKTLGIYKALHTHLLSLEIDASKALYLICRGIGPGSGPIFASYLFEGLAILFTRGVFTLEPDDPAFHPLRSMSDFDESQGGNPTSSGAFKYVYIHKPDLDSDTQSEPSRLRVNSYRNSKNMIRTRTTSRRRPAQSTSSSKGKAPEKSRHDKTSSVPYQPWSYRRYVAFDKIQQLPEIDSTSYYCPIQTNNPLFDALFVEIKHHGSQLVFEVWVLQMTIRQKHGGVRKGFQILLDLKTRIKNTRPSAEVNFNYVLVVAYNKSAPFEEVEWKFSNAFRYCKGEVFIQFLDISSIPELEKGVTLDDIIGKCEPDMEAAEGDIVTEDETVIPLAQSSETAIKAPSTRSSKRLRERLHDPRQDEEAAIGPPPKRAKKSRGKANK